MKYILPGHFKKWVIEWNLPYMGECYHGICANMDITGRARIIIAQVISHPVKSIKTGDQSL